jgi:hypothetical protein
MTALIPIGLLIGWVILAAITWRYVRERGAYQRGFEAGWKQHVGAQLSEDDQYRRAYTEGWCGLLDTLDTQTPGWQTREARYRGWIADPKFPDFSKVKS